MPALSLLIRLRRRLIGVSLTAIIAIFVISFAAPALASEPVEAGYRDFSYGATCNSTPTGEKPESKLWFNDGSWWGTLCNASSGVYHIYRLNRATQSWIDTGTVVDDRSSSKGDALWDQATQKLYVVSHVFSSSGQPTSASQWGRLYRYSYNTSTDTYSLDSGFPVTVTRGKSETLVMAKDSTGQLWVTYVESGKVMVNRSVGGDLVWGDPFILPASSNSVSVTSDDISSVIQFQGNKIGVLWSNQNTSKMYFAVHRDADADNVWQSEETAIPGPNGGCTGACADDHINLKSIEADSSGRVFAAIKTSLSSSSAPLIMLLVRSTNGNWDSHVFGRKSDKHTRPIVLLDEENGRIYIFATTPESGGTIVYKTSDINNINFPLGTGETFIQSSTDLKINNATSTKQNLNSSTGLVVLASDQNSRFYLHNYLDLNAGNNPPAANFTGTPTSGSAPLLVSFTDTSTGSPTSWSWNFGDGTTSTQQNPTHTYNTAGTYTVSLVATNAAGSNTNTKTNYITVNAPQAPVAGFAGIPRSGSAPLSVSFLDQSFGSPTSWSWNFGDGTTSTQQNPTHTYNTPGAYTVSLTVSNAVGSDTKTEVNYITVGQPPSTVTFLPTNDALVKSTSPSNNYGSLDYLRLRDGSPIYNSYLKFNVTGLGGSVQSAILRLFVTDPGPDGGSVYLVSNNYQGTSTPWTESGLTWNNAPAIGGSPLASAGQVNSGNWIELNVTGAVTGEGVYSFALTNSSTNSVFYSSKESPQPPELVVSTSTSQTPPAANFTGTPTSGSAPLLVSFTDTSTGSPTSWSWNFGDGTTSTQQNPTHTYNTAGTYTVSLVATNAAGSNTNTKTNYITVNDLSQFTLTVNTVGSGSVSLSPSGGAYAPGTIVTLTANPAPGFNFSGWSGDLTSLDNPATITMDANKVVNATFTGQSTGGTVVHQETRTGASTSMNSVSTSTNLTGVNGNLYLASIATKPRIGVASVSGLGLNWTRVKAQCGGRNQTGVEVWMAQGTPSGNGAVSATLLSAPTNTVIAVSRYSDVDPAAPVGNVVSANTNGPNGACSGGIDNNAYSVNLTTTVNGAMAYGAVALRNRNHTPGSGYTERAEIAQGSGGDVASVAVEDKTVASATTTAVNGSFSGSVDWAVVGLEIRPGGGDTLQLLTSPVMTETIYLPLIAN